MKTKRGKPAKWSAILLALAMSLSLLPFAALAADDEDSVGTAAVGSSAKTAGSETEKQEVTEYDPDKPYPGGKMVSIAVVQAPERLVYTEGEPFAIDGLVIAAAYSDGKTYEIEYNKHSSHFYSEPDFNVDGPLTLEYDSAIVHYIDFNRDNASVTFPVTVMPKGESAPPVDAAGDLTAVKNNPFVDVASDAYYYDAVLWAAEKGITTGVDATHFDPDLGITRAQVVTFLWRSAGSPEVTITDTFSDVASGSYYEMAVAWAVEKGITKGTSETAFSPDQICTRAQIVTFLARNAGVADAETASSFSDVAPTDFFAAAVAWAVENGITKGTDETHFSPNDNCTRAQVVTFLYRSVNH